MDNLAIDSLLRNNPIFSSLDAASRKNLLSQLTVIELTENEILFYQGDPSENIYLLAKGKLAALLVNGMGESRIVGYIVAGETVGEMGVLANEPRTLTIKALNKSVLLKLSKKDFLVIAHQYPMVLFAIINPLISRSVGLMQILAREKKNKSIVILTTNQDASMLEFVNTLQKVAEKYPSTLFISDKQSGFSDKSATADSARDSIKLLIKDNKPVHRICYILSSHESILAKIALKRAGTIYIAVDTTNQPMINSGLLTLIKDKNNSLGSLPNLILIHPPGTISPKNTIDWIQLASFKLHHHVRLDTLKDFEKLLRFIRGKAIGVVLSGGGTRGWAHIGAIKAIRESKIPIDIIGGASVGALIAALYGLKQSHKDTGDKFRQIVIESKHSISWRSFTWPIISIFDAKRYTNAQIKALGKSTIEDLWLPYFCITSNMSTNSEQTHQHGLLWEVVRASTSIPGILPPMLLNGELHLDGGLLNNLPTDVMRNLIGQKGKIIAIELNGLSRDKNHYHFPPIITLKEALLCKLKFITKYKFPSFVDIFFRGIFLSSHIKGKNNAMLSNIYVNLDLTGFKFLHSNPDEGEQLMKIGYEETMQQIERSRKKNIEIIDSND